MFLEDFESSGWCTGGGFSFKFPQTHHNVAKLSVFCCCDTIHRFFFYGCIYISDADPGRSLIFILDLNTFSISSVTFEHSLEVVVGIVSMILIPYHFVLPLFFHNSRYGIDRCDVNNLFAFFILSLTFVSVSILIARRLIYEWDHQSFFNSMKYLGLKYYNINKKKRSYALDNIITCWYNQQ